MQSRQLPEAKVFKVALDLLNRETIDINNNSKSIAEALVDGSITDNELIKIFNNPDVFPNNNNNKQNLPEGEYASQDAMMYFVRAIGYFISDSQLYELTHRLAAIE